MAAGESLFAAAPATWAGELEHVGVYSALEAAQALVEEGVKDFARHTRAAAVPVPAAELMAALPPPPPPPAAQSQAAAPRTAPPAPAPCVPQVRPPAPAAPQPHPPPAAGQPQGSRGWSTSVPPPVPPAGHPLAAAPAQPPPPVPPAGHPLAAAPTLPPPPVPPGLVTLPPMSPDASGLEPAVPAAAPPVVPAPVVPAAAPSRDPRLAAPPATAIDRRDREFQGVVLGPRNDLRVATDDRTHAVLPLSAFKAAGPPLLRYDRVTVSYSGAEQAVVGYVIAAPDAAVRDRGRVLLCRLCNQGELWFSAEVPAAAACEELTARYGAEAGVTPRRSPGRAVCASKLLAEHLLRAPVSLGGAAYTTQLEYPLQPPTGAGDRYYLFVPADDDVPFIRVPAAAFDPVPYGARWWDMWALVRIESYQVTKGRQAPVAVGRVDALVPDLLAAVEACGGGAPPPPRSILRTHEAKERLDLTNEYVFSIDKRGTTLFDDAFSVTRVEGGGWVVMVHIADPTMHVPAGGEVDAYVRARLADLYVPQRGNVERMMPDEINEAASLRAGAVRPAMSFVFRVSEAGEVLYSEILETWIANRCCLDMLDEMTWATFLATAGHPEGDAVSPGARAAALEHAATLHRAMAAMTRHVGFLQEASQGREGPSQVVQYFMIITKQLASRRLAAFSAGRHHSVYQPPSPASMQRLCAVAAQVQASCGCVLDVASETALCRSLENLRGEPMYPAVAKCLNKLLIATAHGEAHPNEGGEPPAARAPWGAHAEVPCTSPLRKYQDLCILRLLRYAHAPDHARPAEQRFLDMRELDARTKEKRRHGRWLKRRYFLAALYGAPPTRAVLPATVRLWVVDVTPKDGDVELTLYDEVLNEQWTQGIASLNLWTWRFGHETSPPSLYLTWLSDPQRAELRIAPLSPHCFFLAALTLRCGQGYGDYRHGHRILDPKDPRCLLPRLPPLLGDDSPDPYLAVCGPPPAVPPPDFLVERAAEPPAATAGGGALREASLQPLPPPQVPTTEALRAPSLASSCHSPQGRAPWDVPLPAQPEPEPQAPQGTPA